MVSARHTHARLRTLSLFFCFAFVLLIGQRCGVVSAQTQTANKGATAPAHSHAPGTVDEDHVRNDALLAERARHNPAFVTPRDLVFATAPEQLSQLGLWSGVTAWPFAFASVATLPDGRLLAWGGNNLRSFNGGANTYAAVWNPANNQISSINHDDHSMFCAIPTMLEDGRVFVNGGDGTRERVSIFDWRTSLWSRAEDMNRGRWYPGSVALPNGMVFTALGEPGDVYPEVWTPGQGWTLLNGANLQGPILDFTGYNHNWLPYFHLAPNGNIFHSGPTPQMNWINPNDSGSIANAGINNSWYPKYSGTVMYDKGKILVTGGQLGGNDFTVTNQAQVIDLNGANATRTPVAAMAYARKFHNALVLPTGEVLVVGGTTVGTEFDDSGTVLAPEIWNPETGVWRTVADISVPRNYHSVAVLLTDGRVWSGGGGLCDCAADHPDHQLFTPPYLYTAAGTLATRPTISNAPAQAVAGQTINVQATASMARFSLIKMAGLTHNMNSDLRYLRVPFTSPSSGQYQLTLDGNRNVLTPGYWMLFAVNAAGVPSIARVIQVVTALGPVVTTPVVQNSTLNTAVSLQVRATSPTGATLSYSATGLPPGTSINGQTGVISGTLTQTGTFRVTVTVGDGTSAQVSFDWFVRRPNVAQGKTATQASTYESAVASRAVDGNTNGNYAANSVTHTNSAANAWWQVDLGASHTLDSLQLWNRTDCCQARLQNFYVFVSAANQSGRSFTTILNDATVWRFYQAATAPSTLNIPAGLNGRYVRVQLAGTNYLSLAEVRAFGALPQANRPPVLGTLANRVNSVGNAVNATLTATDPDGDALTFTATGLPPGVSLSSAGVLSGTTTTAGTYNVNVSVSDGRGGTATGSFAWTVNAQLALNAIIATPRPVNTNITYTASAINGINPRFKWLFGDGTAETAYSASASVTKSFAQPGLYVVRCTATDDRGLEVNTMFVQAVHLPSTANRPAVSMNIVLEDRAAANDRLWVVNQDNDTVSVFDAVTNAKQGEIAVGAAPRSLAIAPNGRVWVTNKRAATISIIDPATLAVAQTLTLQYAAQPFGIAFAPTGGVAWVALEAAGKLIRLDAVTGAVTGTVNTGPNVRHLSLTGDGSRVYLARFISPRVPGEETAAPQAANGGGEVLVINTATLAVTQTIRLQHSNEPDAENSGRGIPNYLGPAVISPDGANAWTPSKQDNLLRGTARDGRNLSFDSTVRSITSRLNLTTNAEDYPARLDHNNGGSASTGLFDRTGNYLFVALEGSREIAVVDAYGKREIIRVNVGRAPQGLALSADGQRLFVSNFMERTVSVLNLTTLLNGGDQSVPVLATLNAVAAERLTAQVLNGKRLFYDARDVRLAQDAYLSCASCHNDGGHDGRVWDLTGFGEGLRNTIALQGRAAAQGFAHWSANFDEVQDFEGQIRNLSGGTGLMTDAQFNTGTRSQPLGDRKTGVSVDLDALAAYVASLSAFSQSPYRTNGALTADAVTGRQIFQTANCAQCHSGTAFTEGLNGTLRNIGTLKPTSGTRLGLPLTGIDTPTLRDVWATAPYLHDGSAATLEAAIGAHNGVTIAGADLPKLAAYLQQIGSEEVSAPAANQPPTVSLTAPANNATFTAPATINLAANAADGDGTIARVEFYQSATKLGEDTAAPYAFAWTGVAAGSYSLTARAFDNAGGSTNSTAVNVTVNSPANQLPTVSLTAPANNATFTAPATINLTANAADGDGTIARVEFYQGATKLGEDTTAPYAFAWTGVAAGAYSLTARAFDNAGASANSTAVNVTVTATGGGGVQNVIWTNLVNSTLAGAVLRKTAGGNDGSWDGSAVSQQVIASADGYVEFTASGPNVYRAAGLNGAGAVNTPDSLDYAVVFTNTNIVEFRQAGAYRGDAFFAANDVFRIAVESGIVNFYKNGVRLASGSVAPTYPLKAAAVFSYLNGEISNAKISGGGGGGGCTYAVAPLSLNLAAAGGAANLNVTTAAGCAWTAASNATWLTVTAGASGTGNGTVTVSAAVNTGAQRSATVTLAGQTVAVTQAGATATGNTIVWTDLVNTTVIGNVLRKTGGASDGSWDGSAASQQALASGAGWLEFTASGPLVYHAVGLNAQGALGKEGSIDFAVVFTNGNYVEFRESGAYLGDAVFVAGDVFRVAIEGARVNFYKNGILLAQSAGAPAYPIRAAAVFANVGGEVSNAKLTAGTIAAAEFDETPLPWLQRGKQWLNSLVAVLGQ